MNLIATYNQHDHIHRLLWGKGLYWFRESLELWRVEIYQTTVSRRRLRRQMQRPCRCTERKTCTRIWRLEPLSLGWHLSIRPQSCPNDVLHITTNQVENFVLLVSPALPRLPYQFLYISRRLRDKIIIEMNLILFSPSQQPCTPHKFLITGNVNVRFNNTIILPVFICSFFFLRHTTRKLHNAQYESYYPPPSTLPLHHLWLWHTAIYLNTFPSSFKKTLCSPHVTYSA